MINQDVICSRPYFFFFLIFNSIRAAHKMKILLKEHTLETLSRAVRITHVLTPKVPTNKRFSIKSSKNVGILLRAI